MLTTKHKISAAILAILISQGVQADWTDFFKDAAEKVVKDKGSEIAKSAVSNSDVVSGLKEALANGVETAINTLGKPGGFAGNKLVEIAVPDSLKTIASTARTLGQGEYVDSFESSMNLAAEKAVPEAAEILSNAIRDMSVDDAMTILNGPDDAATQYFRKVSEASLVDKFKPIVSEATDKTGVTSAYKQLTGKAAPLLGGIMKGSSLDLDQYVTDKSLDGLFQYIAKEEKSIRENPAARTTDILKKVFSK
jgi:hypothetical protein